MDIASVLGLLLVAIGIVAAGVAAWAAIELARTARSVRTLSDDVDARLIPLLDKADASLDLLNAELLRIDGIVTQVEEVSDRVTTTSETVSDVVRAPLAFVIGFADRLRRSRGRAGVRV